MITPDIFQEDFPELSNTYTFPLSTVQYWIGIGEMMLVQWRWGPPYPTEASPSVSHNFYDYGMELWVAHNIVVEAEGLKVAGVPSGTGGQGSGIPGGARGFVTATAAGDVSVTYGGQESMMEDDAGLYNQTVYGQRFIRLARLVGSGPIYVSPGYNPFPLTSSQAAWPGLLVIPGWPFT